MMHRQTAVLGSLLLFLVSMPALADRDESAQEKRKYRGGVVRVAAFVVPTIDTTIVARSENVPLKVYIDLSKDLGLKNSGHASTSTRKSPSTSCSTRGCSTTRARSPSGDRSV